ncbi:Peroxisomal membrane protein PEX14 [Sesamum alatum]|uniref:Peroxisomal membrane protein PEX14 n=1 Tax=Sesamum alatum TaxID=300844 RepID=A0AAE1YBT1_9LAMI|nr:Peroxisomal membrane protein PEX14 [Sesamum alatum]
MAAPADAPPSSAGQNPQNPVPAGERTTVDVVKESSPSSVFVNSEPIREEQVQNAVKFLSHPKVRGSPVIHRRSFLERKGLTKEEIDEAFRRVPDLTPSVQTTEPVVPNQDGQIKSSPDVQPQAPMQVVQSNQILPVGRPSKLETDSRFHWSYALLAVGFLAVSGAGTVVLFKNAINFQVEVVDSQEKKCFEELMGNVNAQYMRLKSMKTAIQKLEGATLCKSAGKDRLRFTHSGSYTSTFLSPLVRFSLLRFLYHGVFVVTVRSSSRPAPADHSVAPHPKSYMEEDQWITATKSQFNPLIKSRSSTQRPKPWEVSQPQTNILQTQESSKSSNYKFPSNSLSGDDAAPWWQRKNVRITEFEARNENKLGSFNVLGNEQPAKRSWVPPQPPPVVMPEAAAAIRQPKKPSYQKEQTTDDQLLARSPDVTDELQRITRISEAGGTMEANGKTSVLSSSDEIQAEENSKY